MFEKLPVEAGQGSVSRASRNVENGTFGREQHDGGVVNAHLMHIFQGRASRKFKEGTAQSRLTDIAHIRKLLHGYTLHIIVVYEVDRFADFEP